MRKISVFIFFGVLLSVQSFAFPVENGQMILRDDRDSNLYYFSPERMVLASDPVSKSKQYGCFENGAVAIVNSTFTFEISEQLKQSFADIKKVNPNAKIAALSLKSTQFVDQHVTNVKISCDGTGITFGAQVACSWQLNGAHACGAFKNAATSSTGIHILDLSFTFRGIVQGHLKDITRAIPVVISDLN